MSRSSTTTSDFRCKSMELLKMYRQIMAIRLPTNLEQLASVPPSSVPHLSLGDLRLSHPSLPTSHLSTQTRPIRKLRSLKRLKQQRTCHIDIQLAGIWTINGYTKSSLDCSETEKPKSIIQSSDHNLLSLYLCIS